MSVVVRNIRRVDAELVEKYAGIGVATIHEAQGRKGLLASYMRPVYRPCHIAGPAVTCEMAPGDNWMLHVAVEQCREGRYPGRLTDFALRRRLFRRADRDAAEGSRRRRT